MDTFLGGIARCPDQSLKQQCPETQTLDDLLTPQTYRCRDPERSSHFSLKARVLPEKSSRLSPDLPEGESPGRSYSLAETQGEGRRMAQEGHPKGKALFTFQRALLFQKTQSGHFPQQWWDGVRIPHALRLRLPGCAICLQQKSSLNQSSQLAV